MLQEFVENQIMEVDKGLSGKERKETKNLIRKFKDKFASYHDGLKAYKGDVVQHSIPLKEGIKPLRHKLAPLFQRELQKLYEARIIVPTKHYTWPSYPYEMQGKIDELIELDENRRYDFDHLIYNQEKKKSKFDKNTRRKRFQKGDFVILWNKRNEKAGKHGKFESIWLGPYMIEDVACTNSFYLSYLDGEKFPFPTNG